MSAIAEPRIDAVADGQIPVLDAGPYFAGEPGALEPLAEAVRHAQERIGFYFLAGHGVPAKLIERTFDAIGRFFALPEAEKLALRVNEHQIGYIPPKASLLTTSGIENNTKLDTNEAFQLQADRSPWDPKVVAGVRFNARNQWPPEERVPGLREAMLAYHDAMLRLGWRMLPVYARALDLPEDYLYRYFREPHFINRNAHYAPGEGEENQFGLAPHSDHGFVTFLPMSKVPGLQVRTQAGDWIDVPYVPDAMLINTGEFLNRWSNGRFIATPHRVTIPREDRLTITFFYNPSDETLNDPFPTCVAPGNPQKYETKSFIRYLTEYAEGNYLHQAEYAKKRATASGSA